MKLWFLAWSALVCAVLISPRTHILSSRKAKLAHSLRVSALRLARRSVMGRICRPIKRILQLSRARLERLPETQSVVEPRNIRRYLSILVISGLFYGGTQIVDWLTGVQEVHAAVTITGSRVADSSRNPLAAVNTSVAIAKTTNIVYAIEVDTPSGRVNSGNNTTWYFRVNSGSWTQLSTTSSPAKLVASATLVNGSTVTSGERVVNTSCGTFIASLKEFESSNPQTAASEFRDGECSETQASIDLSAANSADDFEFKIEQVHDDGTATLIGTAHVYILFPTAVRLSSFSANSHEGGVHLSWKTGYEINNLGFHIYREENGQRIRLTPEAVAGTALLAGGGTTLTAGHSYSWWDDLGISGQRSAVSGQPSAVSGQHSAVGGQRSAVGGQKSARDPQSSILYPQSSSVQYWLEDIDLNGTRTWHLPVTPVVSHEALPRSVKPELLSEFSRRLNQKYDDFWRAQDLKEKLHSRGPREQARRARVVKSASTAVGQQQIKQDAGQRVQANKQDQSMQWNLASRPAVKILVKEKGWYRVSRAELIAAGLSPAATPRKLQLYRDGREQPIKVLTQKSGKTETLSAIEFYGEGLDTPSTDTRAYWLIEGPGRGKRIEESRSRKQGSLGAPSFPFTVEKKDRVFYFAALKNGEAESFFGPLVTTEPVDQVLTVAHRDPAPPEDPVLEIALQGGTNVAHRVQVLFNEVEVGEVIFAGQSRSEATFSIPQSYLLDGDNVVTLVSQGGETDISLIDEIRLTYWHSYTADGDRLRFSAQGGEQVSIDGFSQTPVRVVDVTDPNAVLEVAGLSQPNGTGYAVTVQVPGQGSRTLLALTENQALRPVSLQANQPSAWHRRGAGADLVIISHKNFLDQVEPLKALRQGQGLAVALIDAQDLYDEFNFGVKSPQAIKDFLTRARSNWRRPPRFVLLVGDASFDPKNYLGFGDFDLVPTKLVETTYFKTASDDWFVDLDGNGLPEIAIGRLPVRTAEEATTVISKIINYEQGAASTPRNALLVSDRNDGFDFEGASEQIETLLPASLIVQKIFRNDFASDAEARSTLISSLNQGSLLVNYAGHGSVEILRGLFSSDDARTLTNGSRLPFFVSMTCLNGFFHDVYTESLAEVLLKAEQGGAVAVWASSALTEPWEQGVMNRELVRLLFNGGSLTLGEAASNAKAMVTDPDIRRSWILFGDPTTRLR